MDFYYTKQEIGGRLGVPARSVEKFSPARADELARSGVVLEKFDAKNKTHAAAPGANAALSAIATREAEEYAKLEMEEKRKKSKAN